VNVGGREVRKCEIGDTDLEGRNDENHAHLKIREPGRIGEKKRVEAEAGRKVQEEERSLAKERSSCKDLQGRAISPARWTFEDSGFLAGRGSSLLQ